MITIKVAKVAKAEMDQVSKPRAAVAVYSLDRKSVV